MENDIVCVDFRPIVLFLENTLEWPVKIKFNRAPSNGKIFRWDNIVFASNEKELEKSFPSSILRMLVGDLDESYFFKIYRRSS